MALRTLSSCNSCGTLMRHYHTDPHTLRIYDTCKDCAVTATTVEIIALDGEKVRVLWSSTYHKASLKRARALVREWANQYERLEIRVKRHSNSNPRKGEKHDVS